jgi:hypothetical protein
MGEERHAFGLHDSLASGTCIYLSGRTLAGGQPSVTKQPCSSFLQAPCRVRRCVFTKHHNFWPQRYRQILYRDRIMWCLALSLGNGRDASAKCSTHAAFSFTQTGNDYLSTIKF